jgi:hypothetical protein
MVLLGLLVACKNERMLLLHCSRLNRPIEGNEQAKGVT